MSGISGLSGSNPFINETKMMNVEELQRRLGSIGFQLRDTAGSGDLKVEPINAARVTQVQPVTQSFAFPERDFWAFKCAYERNHDDMCPSLEAFCNVEDATLLQNLLARWTLDSGICFFDLLGLDIYHDWKKQGADPNDLTKFGSHCRRLSEELLKMSKAPVAPRVIHALWCGLQLLENKVPETVRPKFRFFLKALQHPNQAVALGISPVQWFNRNEVLDGVYSRRKDVEALLDFACEMHPQELDFLRTLRSDKDRSQQLTTLHCRLMDELKKKVNRVHNTDLGTLVGTLKQIIDNRLLQKNISYKRLLCNIQILGSFENSSHYSWMQGVMSKYLGENFAKRGMQVVTHLNKESPPPVNGLFEIPPDTLYQGMLCLANGCPSQRLGHLEKQILRKLDAEREKCKDPEVYAVTFFELLCLYQIVHDINSIRDVTQDTLEGGQMPDSFAERAFLPMIEAAKESEAPVNIVMPAELPSQPASVVPEETAPAPKVKVKTRGVQTSTTEQKGPSASSSAAPSVPAPERPDFPARNVSGRTVFRHLLNHGFVISGIRGSHYQMQHVMTGVQTTVPFYESLKRGTLGSIRSAFYRSQGFEE